MAGGGGGGGRRRRWWGGPRLVTGALVLGASAASAAYVRSGDLLMHECIFGASLALIWPRTLYLVYRDGGGGGGGGEGSAAEAEMEKLRRLRRRRRRLRRFWRAVALLVAGYAAWNADLEMCARLRALRGRLGLPWAWLLELHGWWHVLTALGASEYIRLVRDLCLWVLRAVGSVPFVVVIDQDAGQILSLTRDV